MLSVAECDEGETLRSTVSTRVYSIADGMVLIWREIADAQERADAVDFQQSGSEPLIDRGAIDAIAVGVTGD